MTAAVCHIPKPPHDCPLQGWPASPFILGAVPGTNTFERLEVFKCQICGCCWNNMGEAIPDPTEEGEQS